ncbi:Ribosomal protein S18 acetylase RimI [Jatrophihabitans endophyticus]|uniref:Ribosomal protein S18 acetylase RimI n=1 Tax=Jatrophihabitans endophyticus TaxID=1206085 RepID=A0A1M5CYQ3_9ACTN|nr:GNAT family N-acetyltransferase [Jatrophihabitans endophyticus]SHF59765.1 Ribosomal protein S18 acetylase RimI [Jatrophihabitans endophyticus]
MSRANVRVRPATPEDIDALAELVHTVDPQGAGHAARQAGTSTERLCSRFADLLDRTERTLLVATDENAAVVGMLGARVDEVGTVELTPVLHVTHLLVAPRCRRRGIGRALLAAAVHLADDAAVEHVLATSAAGSREGNRYLARIGFAPLVVHRIASTAVLRRSLGMTDVAGRMAALRRARMARRDRAGFGHRAVGRGA